MSKFKPDEIRNTVRQSYSRIAGRSGGDCGCSPQPCCSDKAAPATHEYSTKFGYTEEELRSAPDSADLGLGCGNPAIIAELEPGETVLDLGSGAGLDCFLASKRVGDSGRVIGVDMTPDMISRSREAARANGYTNVEFRLGEIEHLPAADASIDVILSNCVINLSPDKPAVFRDAFRVLKPGGRLAISDIVAKIDLPEEIKNDLSLYSCCVSGAAGIEETTSMLRDAGFADISIEEKGDREEFIREWAPGRGIEKYIVPAYIKAKKPL
jgi:SAM-dependent methyltransferase